VIFQVPLVITKVCWKRNKNDTYGSVIWLVHSIQTRSKYALQHN